VLDAGSSGTVVEDLVLLKGAGVNPVLVHGGGPEITRMLDRVGKATRFVQGLRVTDEETMEIVEMVLAGRANKALVTMIGRAGGSAVGLSGKDAGLFRARRLAGPVDLGLVGEVVGVQGDIVTTISNAGHIPVIASIGLGDGGESLNLNADHAAGALAAALGASKMIILTDVPGIMRSDGGAPALISSLSAGEARRLIAEGVVSRGMIPKVEACLAALDRGVPSAHIIGADAPHALLVELFTEQGVGTMITPSPGGAGAAEGGAA
jgi:acetylglutamate kinase